MGGNHPPGVGGTYIFTGNSAELSGLGNAQHASGTAAFEFGTDHVVNFGFTLALVDGEVSNPNGSASTIVTWTCQYRDDDPNYEISFFGHED